MTWQAYLKYPLVLLAAFLATLLLTPLVRRAARALGMVDQPDARRIHATPTPRGGGVAVFGGFHLACALIFLVPWEPFEQLMSAGWWWRFLSISAFLLAVGLADDARGMRPWVKLLGQVLAASAVYACGMRFGNALGLALPAAVDYAITVLWVLVFINAFNLIDGLDGLASGLAIIAALGVAGGLLFRHLPGDALVLAGLVGACAAFLIYNSHPASIFLGDSGSMFLGLTLAAVSLSTNSKGTAMAAIGVPLLAIGIPVFDTMLAIWRRSVRRLFTPGGEGKVMQADTEHLHHRLLKTGLSHSRVATALFALNAFLVGVALLALMFRTSSAGLFLIAFVVATYVIVRHLARIELWDSGAALLRGLRRPPHRALPLILYLVYDVAALVVAFGLALWLASPDLAGEAFKLAWFDRLPVWVGMPFLAGFLGKAYRRIWSKARISDYAELGAALAAGIAVALGIAILLGAPFSRRLLLLAVLYAGLVVPACTGARALFRILQDAMALAARHPAQTGGRRATLVYGASDLCALFLRQRSLTYPPCQDGRRIVGLLLDDRNAHGRLVYGYPVLGGLDGIEELIAKRRVAEVICACDHLETVLRERLQTLARNQNLVVTLWSIEEKRLEPYKQ